MFEYISKCFMKEAPQSKEITENGCIQKEPNKDFLEAYQNDDNTIIYIKENCTLEEYCNALDQTSETIHNLHIPMRLFFTKKQMLQIQKLHIFDFNNCHYVINYPDTWKPEEVLIISETKQIDNKLHETVLELYSERKCTVHKYIHDLNLSTKICKWYPCKDELCKAFSLEKKEALTLAQTLLDNLQSKENIDEITGWQYFNTYSSLNLIPAKNFYPVISDEIITLSWKYHSNKDNINKENWINLDIILNETKEEVGSINVYYHTPENFNYSGNVSYDINEEFQNNHYATRALCLLKKLVQNNEFEGDKNLYVAVEPENIRSQKVAENNNGTLIYDGDVPKEDVLYYMDGVKKVKIYRIDIENSKNKKGFNL